MSKPESLPGKLPLPANHGVTSETRNGVITTTITNPDGSQTVKTQPAKP
jgi:hypothetical protein